MKHNNITNILLLSNPLYRGIIEYLLLFGTGIIGLLFSWSKLPLFPVLNIFGGILILGGFIFHIFSERDHKQAHEKSTDIVRIVSSGFFSKIRHPLYLSVIVMNLGIAFCFGVVATLLIALVSVIHWIMTALKEEEYLLKTFGEDYRQYKRNVQWRFLPGVF